MPTWVSSLRQALIKERRVLGFVGIARAARGTIQENIPTSISVAAFQASELNDFHGTYRVAADEVEGNFVGEKGMRLLSRFAVFTAPAALSWITCSTPPRSRSSHTLLFISSTILSSPSRRAVRRAPHRPHHGTEEASQCGRASTRKAYHGLFGSQIRPWVDRRPIFEEAPPKAWPKGMVSSPINARLERTR